MMSFQQILFYFHQGITIILLQPAEYFFLLEIIFSDLYGNCHVETSNLDDETNLKIRQCPQETSYCKELQDIINLNGIIECEFPNKLLYHFLGRLTIMNNL